MVCSNWTRAFYGTCKVKKCYEIIIYSMKGTIERRFYQKTFSLKSLKNKMNMSIFVEMRMSFFILRMSIFILYNFTKEILVTIERARCYFFVVTRGIWAASLTWETVTINKHICENLWHYPMRFWSICCWT